MEKEKMKVHASFLTVFKDAIRRIKNQKQRPGFDRIAQNLKTHHSLSDLGLIKQHLDAAVRDGELLPVWTKGLQCYKDPESLLSLRKFTVQSPADVRRAAKAAVREIGDPNGSKLSVINSYVRHSFAVKTTSLDAMLPIGLEYLSNKGDLIRCEGQRYKPKFTCPATGTGTGTDTHLTSSAFHLDFPSTSASPEVANSGSNSAADEESDSDADEILPVSSRKANAAKKLLAAKKLAQSPSPPPTPPPKKEKVNIPTKVTKPIKKRSASPSLLLPPIKKISKKTTPPKEKEKDEEKDDEEEDAESETSEHDGISGSTADGREFLSYQCWCCRFFTASQVQFLKHVGSRGHGDNTLRRIVHCSVCRFRTRNRKRLLGHLQKHSCHTDKGAHPACLLTFGQFTTLTALE